MKQFIIKRQRFLYPLGCWLIVLAYLLIIPPANLIAFAGLYILLFSGLYCTLALRISNKYALLWSSTVCTYLFLRQLRQDTLPVLLMLAAAVCMTYLILRGKVRRRFGK